MLMIDEIIATRISLLSKSAWNWRDITKYYPHIKSKPTAIKVKNMAIKNHNGTVPYGSEFATSESILNLFGSSRLEEIQKINKIILEANHTYRIVDIDFKNKAESEYYEED